MPLSKDDLGRIVGCGVQAPSGDNCQPWDFRWDGKGLRLLNDAVRGEHFFNIAERASHIAHGALIENMDIAARTLGYAAKWDLFPEGENGPCVARVEFDPAAPAADPLFPFIHARCTNRKPHDGRPLEEAAKSALRAAAGKMPGGELHLVEGAAQKDRLARLATISDRMIFEIRGFHDSLFRWMRWSEEEARSSNDGLLIDTLELKWLDRKFFKLLSSWPLVRVLSAFGASRVVARVAYGNYKKSAAFGFLQMPSLAARDFVSGGRLLQRIWLTTAAQGLAFQPLAGLPILIQKIHSAGGTNLERRHVELISEAERELKAIVPVDCDKAGIMLFRIGYAPPPSALSPKREVPPLW